MNTDPQAIEQGNEISQPVCGSEGTRPSMMRLESVPVEIHYGIFDKHSSCINGCKTFKAAVVPVNGHSNALDRHALCVYQVWYTTLDRHTRGTACLMVHRSL